MTSSPDGRRPVVPYVPWRCPSCGSTKPRTYSQSGRTRYHRCQACGIEFLSREIASEALAALPAARGLVLPPAPAARPDTRERSLPEALVGAGELARVLNAPERAVAAAAPRLHQLCRGFPPVQSWHGRPAWDRLQAEDFIDRGGRNLAELRQAVALATHAGGAPVGRGPVQIDRDGPRRP